MCHLSKIILNTFKFSDYISKVNSSINLDVVWDLVDNILENWRTQSELK